MKETKLNPCDCGSQAMMFTVKENKIPRRWCCVIVGDGEVCVYGFTKRGARKKAIKKLNRGIGK